MKRLFLQPGYEALKSHCDALSTKVSGAGQEVGEAAGQSESGGHDNAPFDAAMAELGVLSRQLRDMEDILRDAQIVPFPTDTEKVQLGHLVEVIDHFDESTHWYLIASAWLPLNQNESNDGSTEDEPITISCESPIGRALLGKSPACSGLQATIGGKRHNLGILEILIPTPTTN